MSPRRDCSRARPALGLLVAISLIVAGCGGSTPPPSPGVATSTTVATEPAPTAPKARGSTSRRGQQLAPGGDLGVRERRAQKLKEKAAAQP